MSVDTGSDDGWDTWMLEDAAAGGLAAARLRALEGIDSETLNTIFGLKRRDRSMAVDCISPFLLEA